MEPGYLVKKKCPNKLKTAICKSPPLPSKKKKKAHLVSNFELIIIYRKYKPYQKFAVKPEDEKKTKDKCDSENANGDTVKKPEIEEYIEEKEYLLGPYLGQYVVYTGLTHAWLLE